MAHLTSNTNGFTFSANEQADLDSMIRVALLEARCTHLQRQYEAVKAEVDALRKFMAISPDALVKRVNRRLAKGYPFQIVKAARPEYRGSLGHYYMLSHSADGWNFEAPDVDLMSLAKELGIVIGEEIS